jgi:hypothetical protein
MIYPADMAAGRGIPSARIDVVLNWFEELRRSLPAK